MENEQQSDPPLTLPSNVILMCCVCDAVCRSFDCPKCGNKSKFAAYESDAKKPLTTGFRMDHGRYSDCDSSPQRELK